MIIMKYLALLTILFVCFISGCEAKRSAFDEDLLTYIDYEKYLNNEGQRFRRQVNITVNGTRLPPLNFGPPPPNFPPPDLGPGPFPENHPNLHHHQHDGPICADPVNEVYQECGGKCVLGCRYASTTADFTISKKDCDKNDCVAGCFCKTGLVRHQSKCIIATECPIRKCHRDEVYQCGPAAPITCENVFREHEIIEKTKHLDCVWGCYCPKGYLRNSYNGKCVAEGSCRSNKIIDVSPQIPGLFTSRHLFRPHPVAPCFGAQCGCQGPSCGGACYGSTCGSCHGSNCNSKPPSTDIHNHNAAYAGPGYHQHPGGGYGNTGVNNFYNYGTGWGGSYAGGWNGAGNGNGGYGYNGYPLPGYGYPLYPGPYPYYNGNSYYSGYYPYPYPGYPGPTVNGTVNGNFGLTLGDEIADDPVSNDHPRPAIDHYHHWEGDVKDSALSGNCIGSNVCNGAASGVNNKLAGSDPSLNDDSESDQYEENQDDNSKEDVNNDGIDVDDSQANNNENGSKPSGDETNENSYNKMAMINNRPLYNQSPSNPFHYNPIAVIGASVLPDNIPFNVPYYFNYRPNVKDNFDQEPDSKVETSTKKPNRKNQSENAQTAVVDDPKKQLNDALLHNIHQSNNFQSFPNAPNHFEQIYGPNPFAPNQFQVGQFLSNSFEPNRFEPNPFAQSQFPTAQSPNSNIGPNSFGPGQFPSNQFPSNNFNSNQFNSNNPNSQNPQLPNGQFNHLNAPPYNSPLHFNAQNGPNFPPNYYQGIPPFGFQQNGQSFNLPSQSHAFNNPNFPHIGSSANRETLNAKPLKLHTPAPETEDANNKNVKRKSIKDMKRPVNSNNCVGENVCNPTR